VNRSPWFVAGLFGLFLVVGMIRVEFLTARVEAIKARVEGLESRQSPSADDPGNVTAGHLSYVARRLGPKALTGDGAIRQTRAYNAARYAGKSASEATELAGSVK
jgi:hypothetical protein